METTIKTVAGLGIPGLIFFYVLTTCGLTGAAAVTFSLAAIGPGGMIGGVAILILAGLISASIAEYGFDELNKGIVNEYLKRGTKDYEIHNWIDSKWFLSRKKKAYLHQIVRENFHNASL